jgi:hypothetical protein
MSQTVLWHSKPALVFAFPLFLTISTLRAALLQSTEDLCSLGASMVVEVIHLAHIPPLEQAYNLFGQGGLRQRHQLVGAIK